MLAARACPSLPLKWLKESNRQKQKAWGQSERSFKLSSRVSETQYAAAARWAAASSSSSSGGSPASSSSSGRSSASPYSSGGSPASPPPQAEVPPPPPQAELTPPTHTPGITVNSKASGPEKLLPQGLNHPRCPFKCPSSKRSLQKEIEQCKRDIQNLPFPCIPKEPTSQLFPLKQSSTRRGHNWLYKCSLNCLWGPRPEEGAQAPAKWSKRSGRTDRPVFRSPVVYLDGVNVDPRYPLLKREAKHNPQSHYGSLGTWSPCWPG